MATTPSAANRTHFLSHPTNRFRYLLHLGLLLCLPALPSKAALLEPLLEDPLDTDLIDSGLVELEESHNVSLIQDELLIFTSPSSLKLTMPDQWHRVARINTHDTSFDNEDHLAFWIRTDAGLYDGPLDLTLAWSGDKDSSQSIPIQDYIRGELNEEYSLVVIPRSDIAGNFTGAFRTMRFEVPAENSNRIFYVDNLALATLNGVSLRDIEVLDNRHLMLTLDKKPDYGSARTLTNYTLSNTQTGSSIDVTDVGLRAWVTGYEGNSRSPVVEHYIYLSLASPLTSSTDYRLEMEVSDQVGNPPLAGMLSFTPDFENRISSSIKVNQVGYLPQSSKRAYIGNYLGDQGSMTIPSDLTGYLVDAETHKTVYQDTLQRADGSDLHEVNGVKVPFAGEEVWTFDFSSVTQEGRYYVRIPSIGRSYDLNIGDQIYDDVFSTTARSLWYQRSGIALPPEHAGKWAREASHLTAPDGSLLCGYYHNSIQDRSSRLYADEPIGEPIDLTGGWYDAADYNKYIHTATRAVNFLLTVYELAPQKFHDSQLNLPESGNGIPDILDEAKWELDWIAKMVSQNGAVFNKVSYENWSKTMPQDDMRKMWAITKTTRDTALAAGALAKAALVLKPFYPDAAERYERKAKLAWECLERHPETYPDIGSDENAEAYCNPEGDPSRGIPNVHSGCAYRKGADDTNARAWASIELFRLTQDPEYNEAFQSLVPDDELNAWMRDHWWYQPENLIAGFDYLQARGADEDRQSRLVKGFQRVIQAFQASEKQWDYSVALKDIPNLGFGMLSMSTRYSFYYILFYHVTGESAYLDHAMANLDTQLGANPLSQSFITGIGDNSPISPTHKISEFDEIEAPVPGISVYGPAYRLPNGDYYDPIVEHAYPSFDGATPYPAARRYTDSMPVVKYGEYVITDLARTAAVFGYFSDWDGPPKTRMEKNLAAYYPFDGDLSDASGNSYHLSANGDARLIDDPRSSSSGDDLVARFDGLGDQLIATLPDAMILPDSGSRVTFEAEIYPREYKAYSHANAPIVGLTQAWDTRFLAIDPKWSDVPHAPSVESILTSADWSEAVTLNQWHTFRLTFDGVDRLYCFIDGTQVAEGRLVPNFKRTSPWTLILGNFDGDIDEVRVFTSPGTDLASSSLGTRDASTPSAPPDEDADTSIVIPDLGKVESFRPSISLDSSSQAIQLQWPTEVGQSYQAWFTPRLDPPQWEAISGPLKATGSSLSWSLPMEDTVSHGFFRITPLHSDERSTSASNAGSDSGQASD